MVWYFVVALLLALGGGVWLKMAGGDEEAEGGAWPQGAQSVVPFQIVLSSLEASKTAHIYAIFTVPFKCRVLYAEYTARAIAITNAITVTVQDDTGTPKKAINAQSLAAVTAGTSAVAALTVVSTNTFFKGALLEAQYTSGASDTGSDVVITLWLKPE
jgi:hypothetical protein